MAWKRIIPIISLGTMIGALSSNFVSTNIGDQTGYKFLNSLKDFDWKNLNFGDGLEYLNSNSEAKVTDPELEKKIEDGIKQNIISTNRGRFLDYSKFSTGFQYSDAVKKQAVTGAPLNWGFMPNGNPIQDFGVTSKAQKYLTVNSILDWNQFDDKDARYNKSYIPLRKSTTTAFIYPKSTNKNKDMKFDYLGHSTRSQSPYDNTVAGVKNPFEGTNLNWQYTSNFVNWAGSSIGGIIVPPPADMIDMAHNNGTPIYGNIFLDGYHGLNRQMLRDFVKKDSKGNYLAVDFLLNIASYSGFDGYFLNDESNGINPNGTTLDYNVLLKMVKQFNQKSYDKGLNKKIIFYRNGSTLQKRNDEYLDRETSVMTKTMPNNLPSDMQLEFGETPERTIKFLKENPNYKPYNLYSMADLGSRNFLFGTYDWRQLAYQTVDHPGDKNHKFKAQPDWENTYMSISGFMDSGPTSFGAAALNVLNNYAASRNNTKAQDFIFANQVSNLYNEILFNGVNTNQSVDDAGLLRQRFYSAYQPLNNYSSNTEFEFILNDPRIYFPGKEKMENDSEPGYSDVVKNQIFGYDGKKDRFENSYGVGNLIQEKTVFEDEDQNGAVTPIKTDFSTGSGINFVDRDKNYSPLEISNYPYTNRKIADILPTYQWDINEIPSDDSVDQMDAFKPDKTGVNKLNGFYDYYDAYLKSNSIAIGSKFDEHGQILPGKWDKNKKYIWNIVGTNISRNHKFTLTYKDNDMADVKPVLTITNQSSGKSKYIEVNDFHQIGNETSDHWKTIEFSLDNVNINSEAKLSKIGLLIAPKNDEFKLNVGEFTMDYNEQEAKNSVGGNLNNFANEYRIERGNLINLRFTYETNLKFDYIEFYIKDKNGKWFRVGETAADEYFIKDIDKKIFGHGNDDGTIDLAAITYKDNQIIGSNRYEIN